MDEILNKLLQSELLSEETKAEISEQWTASVEAFKTQVREEVSGEVRSELAEQWITERDELITKVDGFVAEALTKEIEELKGDIERFRDLEAEYAEKLVEEKHKLAEEVAAELDGLVDKIDAFFEMRLSAEMEELKEDLEVVKQNDFGRKMFEAFASTYAKHYVDEDAVQSKLVVAESKLQDAEAELARLEEDRNNMIREAKMEQILSPLTGKKREQMAMVLKNVDTSRLEESYKFFIGRILKEDEQPATPASKPLNENRQAPTPNKVVTGEPPAAALKPVENQLAEMKRLAGLK
ncbi:hypothetical protein [Acinetobacter sp.]|uniref:hypothetical protein n=1 Tax=Acinetobacter sp. TaxID=472 RepID=UPI00388D2AF7